MRQFALIVLVGLASWTGACLDERAPGRYPRPFDSTLWKSASGIGDERCNMVSDLLDRVKLVGRTRSEVVALLGEPHQHGTGVDHYELCPSLSDIWILEIRWRDGRVASTNIRDT